MSVNLLKNPDGDEDFEHWELTKNGGDKWLIEETSGNCGHDFSDKSVIKYFWTSFEEKENSKMSKNLLKNPNGDEDFEHWEVMENGGDEWRIEEMSGHAFSDDPVTKYFCTSFEPCLKRQVIDLLENGYDPETLDIAQPAVTVTDWYCCRPDCGCIYKLSVALLDENQEVIAEFSPDDVTLDPDTDDCSWKQVTHTFTEYGPGLRFIFFEHGGQDTKYWKGWFGVRVTGSSVTIDV